MDHERVEIEINNHVDILLTHLKRLESLSNGSDVDAKKRLARTASIMSSRTIGLAKQAKRVAHSYPTLT